MGRGIALITTVVVVTAAACARSTPPAPPAPSAAADFLAVWTDDRFDAGLYAARVGTGGVVDPHGLLIDRAPRAQARSGHAVTTASGWAVLWERTGAGVFTHDAWLRRVDRWGRLGDPIALTHMADGDTVFEPAMASAGDDVLVAWGHRTLDWKEHLVRAALLVGDRVVPVELPANQGTSPGIAFDPASGVFVIAWREGSGMTCVLVDRRGEVTGSFAFPLAYTQGGVGYGQLAPLLASTGAPGEVVITWAQLNGRQAIVGALVDTRGARLIGKPRPMATTPYEIHAHTLVAGRNGFVLAYLLHPVRPMPRDNRRTEAWLEEARRAPPDRPVLLWFDHDAPLTRPRPLDVAVPAGTYIAGLQASADGFSITWSKDGEPAATLLDAWGAPRTPSPRALRLVAPEPLPAARLDAGLDAGRADGAIGCDRFAPRAISGRATGLLVENRAYPWGVIREQDRGWSDAVDRLGAPPASHQFYVGRDAPFIPAFAARSGERGVDVEVTVPDANRQRTMVIASDPSTAHGAGTAGIADGINLVTVEINRGLGASGLRFAITGAQVVADRGVIEARIARARGTFDARVAALRPELDRLFAESDQELRRQGVTIVDSEAIEERWTFEPTWRPIERHLEVVFGYARSQRHTVMSDAHRTSPRHVGVMLGARYRLDGDRLVGEELFGPTNGHPVPWWCTPPAARP